MSDGSQKFATKQTFAIFSQGFRPFFCATIWSVTAIGIWVTMLVTGMALPSRF